MMGDQLIHAKSQSMGFGVHAMFKVGCEEHEGRPGGSLFWEAVVGLSNFKDFSGVPLLGCDEVCTHFAPAVLQSRRLPVHSWSVVTLLPPALEQQNCILQEGKEKALFSNDLTPNAGVLSLEEQRERGDFFHCQEQITSQFFPWEGNGWLALPCTD